MLSVVGVATTTTVINILHVVTHLIYRAMIVPKTPGMNFSLSIYLVSLSHELVAHGVESPGTFYVDVVIDQHRIRHSMCYHHNLFNILVSL